MKSSIRKLRNQTPVPYSGSSQYVMPSLSATNDLESYMKAFGKSGTVWQIVNLLYTSTASVDWGLYRKQKSDGRVRYTTGDAGSDERTEVVQHAALDLIENPNPFMSRTQLMKRGQMYKELTGENWIVVERDSRATFPVGLWPVRPDRMEVVPDENDYIRGYIYTAPDGRTKIPLNVDEVLYDCYPNPCEPFRGLGPVQSVLVDIDASVYSSEWNRNFFLNSAEPGGIIEVDSRLSDEEWDELTERWRESHRGVSRAHRVGVLENGAKWVTNQHSLRDMDFANLRNVSRDVIREAWGIHKSMLGDSEDVNRSNAETAQEVFAIWKTVPRLDDWKSLYNDQLLPMFGSTGIGVEFDYADPVPGNREADALELKTKAQAAQMLVDSGYEPHAVLEAVGLPDMDVVERATQQPALPPGWVPPAVAPAQPAEPATEPEPPSEDEMVNRLRRVLRNGHLALPAGRH